MTTIDEAPSMVWVEFVWDMFAGGAAVICVCALAGDAKIPHAGADAEIKTRTHFFIPFYSFLPISFLPVPG